MCPGAWCLTLEHRLECSHGDPGNSGGIEKISCGAEIRSRGERGRSPTSGIEVASHILKLPLRTTERHTDSRVTAGLTRSAII